MPLYEYECDSGHVIEQWQNLSELDKEPVYCLDCLAEMRRVPGGHGMLYFEEGRGRVHIGLSDKPITSYAQREKLMRNLGVVEGGGTVPPSVAKNPQSPALKEYMSKDKKGRWV